MPVNASDELLSTSAQMEFSHDQVALSVLYHEENDIIQGGHLIIKINERGINFLRGRNAPLRMSVLLNCNRENHLYHEKYGFEFVSSKNIDLAITEKAIDFSIDKELYAEIKKISSSTVLFLSYTLSQQEAQILNVAEEHLEQKDAQERSYLVALRRLISQDYKGYI